MKYIYGILRKIEFITNAAHYIFVTLYIIIYESKFKFINIYLLPTLKYYIIYLPYTCHAIL